jgi:hypothetical protein
MIYRLNYEGQNLLTPYEFWESSRVAASPLATGEIAANGNLRTAQFTKFSFCP